MKKIDYDIAKAFAKWEPKAQSNTSVVISEDWKEIYLVLHWNIIVARPINSEDLTLFLPLRWQSQTTKNRINAVFETMDYPISIKAIKTIWHFILPDGSKKQVEPWTNFVHK